MVTIVGHTSISEGILARAASMAGIALGDRGFAVAASLNTHLDLYPYGWSREEIAREIHQALAAYGITATVDQAWQMTPIISAWMGDEVVTETSLQCCSGEHYADPGEAYVHTRCRRLLQPWGDVHDHSLCTCYGKPTAPKLGDGGTFTVIDIT